MYIQRIYDVSTMQKFKKTIFKLNTLRLGAFDNGFDIALYFIAQYGIVLAPLWVDVTNFHINSVFGFLTVVILVLVYTAMVLFIFVDLSILFIKIYNHVKRKNNY